jgi:Zn-dependent protease with chaperone function
LNETKATRFQRLHRRARTAGVACGAVSLVLLAATPGGRWLAAVAGHVGGGWPGLLGSGIVLLAYVGLIVVVWEAMALPAALYAGLRIDRRFKPGEQSADGLVTAQLQAALVGLIGALGASGLVRLALAVAGPYWWLLAGGLLALALVAALHLAPLILPLARETSPLDREPLASRLAALARQAGVELDGLDEWRVAPDDRATALVTGGGRAHRILLSSEMLRDWSDDEIAVVVAHELAHVAHRDLWRTVGLDAVVLSAALWTSAAVVERLAPVFALSGPRDLAALPWIALVSGAVWFAATPLRHKQSRDHERRADRFALTLTGGAEAFTSAVRRLGARHLAEERPSALTRWLFHRHPSVTERLAMAERFRAHS